MVIAPLLFSTSILLGEGIKEHYYSTIIGQSRWDVQLYSCWRSAQDTNAIVPTKEDIINGRSRKHTYIGLYYYITWYGDDYDTTRAWFEMKYPKGSKISLLYGSQWQNFWGWDTIQSPDFIRWEGIIPGGLNAGGIQLSFPAIEGSYLLEMTMKTITVAHVDSLYKIWKAEVTRDSALIFEVTHDGNMQLIDKSYSMYFNWLITSTPSALKWGIGERSRNVLAPVAEGRIPALWVQVLDTFELGALDRFEQAFKKINLALELEDSTEYWNLTHQLIEEWDKALQDYHNGNYFLTPYRDSLFESIVPRLRQLEEKRWEKLNKEINKGKINIQND